ncbi:type II toxin-antitoxin system PemK/MazF family toxin [Rhodoferax antarcticus]|uniref:type II toxin-antitoxin system PemK/MazF family toxin n=1 Tax=Rhodoferax antarcticus TaxID=81479 RepID=UPI002225A82A|nr:type II toxin-antitoxin system PemK/MazF family toxin [Rhodoferax antarcticus]MCW2313122.1 mRNA interferase MazF [Rhodoferax antarcticus]
MTYDSGTLVLIAFPYSDLSATKKRPVLMLTQPDAQGDFVGMPLTTKPQPSSALKLPAGTLPLGGTLPRDSWVKTDTVFSLCTSEVIKSVGHVSEENRIYCVQQLCQTLNRGH